MHDVVTTYDGNIANRTDCRFIKGEYYIKNKQCFFINDKWIRITSKYIVYDNETNNYIHVNDADHLINGIISFDTTSKTPLPIMGKFSPNHFNNGLIYDESTGDKVVVMNVDTALNTDYYIYKNNRLYKSSLKSKVRDEIHPYITIPYNYNSADTMVYFEDTKYKTYYKSLLQENKFRRLHHSYGIEYETGHGMIPEPMCFRYGLIPLKDGSLRRENYTPYEYATIPLDGHETLAITKKHTELLSSYCKLNHMASLHVHQGNHILTKEYVVAYYIVCTMLQDEIYSLFPPFVRKSTTVGKDKDYCRPIPTVKSLINGFNTNKTNVNTIYNALYYYLEGTVIHEDDDEMYLKTSHANNPNNNLKWHISQRYHIVNFVPLLFSNKRTIEWRMHTSTFNFDKISNFLLLLEAISKYVRDNMDAINNMTIKSLTILDVLSQSYYGSDLAYLMNYFMWRKQSCITHEQISSHDIILNELAALEDKVPIQQPISLLT